MKKLTPYLFALFTLVCFALKPATVKASHAAGAEIIYEHAGDSTYRFFFKFYRRCSGSPRPATVSLCLFNPCNNKRWNSTMTLYTGSVGPGLPNGSPVSAGCSDYETTCTDPNSGIPGYEEWWYVCEDSLDGQCDAWRFSVSINARNPQNNLQNAGAQNLYVETTFNNLYAQGNYSPYYAKKPIPFACIDMPFGYNNDAVDPDGDSLSHEMINPLGGTSSCNTAQVPIPLNNFPPPVPPYSIPANPLQTNNSFVLNTFTGQMNFTPRQITGASTLTMKTKEWRNGILIGSIMRDIQVQVLDPTMCNSVPVVFNPSAVGSVEGGIYQNGQIEACIEQKIKFSFTISSTANDAVLIGTDNHATSISGSTVSYTGQRTPSVVGTFEWTPLPTQTGLFSLIVDAIDSTCRPPGVLFTTTYTIPILVWPHTKGFGDTSICPGDQAQISVSGGDDFVWSVINGDLNLPTPPTGPNLVINPFQTTRYQVVSNRTSFCQRNKDTVIVTNLPSPEYTAMDDKTTCPGNMVILDPKIGGATPDPNISYTATWSPGTYLNATSGLTATTTPSADITYNVVIGASNTQCKSFDTVYVDVLDGFTLTNQDTAICVGGQVQIGATGDSRYTWNWKTNDPNGLLAYSDPYKLDPLITPTTIVGEYKYTLSASYTGCKDSVSEITIDVQPIPSVTINDDAIVCFGDTMQLQAVVDPAAYPKYIYKWAPNTALDKSDVLNPIFAGVIVGENTIAFTTTTNGAGCSDTDMITLTVLPSDFMFLSADTAICPDDSINIHMTGVGLKSFYWAENDHISDVMSQDPLVWPTHTVDYVIYGRDTNLCYDTQSVRVTVRPRATIELPDSVTLYAGDSYQITPHGNATNYKWFPPVGLNRIDIANPIAKPEVNTRYTVTAITEANCITSDVIDIFVKDDVYIDLPNAFVPGASPKSWLKPVKMGNAKLISFEVYNRWGIKVFNTDDINEGWDGLLNGKAQPMGVYIYSIDAVGPNGKRVNKNGNVTLIR